MKNYSGVQPRLSNKMATLKSHWHLTCIMIYIFMYFHSNMVIAAAAASGTKTASSRRRKNGNPSSRSVRVMNRSGVRIDIFWIHSVTNELAPSHTDGEGVMFGGETGISSYVGHSFEVQEMPSKKGKKKCVQDVCRKAYFTVNTKEDQWVTIHEDFTVSLEDSTSRAMTKAATALGGCVNITDIQELSACLTKNAEAALDKEQKDIQYQATIRKSMGEQLSDYSCGSLVSLSSTTTSAVSPILLRPVKVKTTPSVRNDTYNGEMVQTLFESEYSNIRLYENFLSVADCETMLRNQSEVSFTIKAKMKRLLDYISIAPNKNHPYIESDNYKLKIEAGPVINEMSDVEDECELNSDGSCTKNTPTTTTETTPTSSHPNYVVERSLADDSVIARIILTCVKSPTAKSHQEGNNTASDDSIDDDILSYTSSGMMYFTKAGVRIVPTDRSAIIIQYNEIADDGLTILREDDPFIDQHIVCPVTQSNMTVATLMYNITH